MGEEGFRARKVKFQNPLGSHPLEGLLTAIKNIPFHRNSVVELAIALFHPWEPRIKSQ
jgi:hypothetical protein